jgi:UDPglucose 6-dehydrogenase
VSSPGPIGVLGISYKPETSVVEQSQGLSLIERLLDEGHRVIAYDPKALPTAQAVLRRSFESAPSAEACVREAEVVVVMTPWPAFRAIPAEAFARRGRRLPVIDCWRVLPADELGATVDLVYLGRGAAQEAPTPA